MTDIPDDLRFLAEQFPPKALAKTTLRQAADEIERLRTALDKIATYGDEGIEGSPSYMLSVAREWACAALSGKSGAENG